MFYPGEVADLKLFGSKYCASHSISATHVVVVPGHLLQLSSSWDAVHATSTSCHFFVCLGRFETITLTTHHSCS